eukprot:5339098-Pleurochrysis_carterae.AAC.1
MRWRRLREQRIRVDLAVRSSSFGRLAFLRSPALALRRCGYRVVVSSLPALGLDSVDVVADGAVVVEWVRLAGDDGAWREDVGAVARVLVVLRTLREAFHLLVVGFVVCRATSAFERKVGIAHHRFVVCGEYVPERQRCEPLDAAESEERVGVIAGCLRSDSGAFGAP